MVETTYHMTLTEKRRSFKSSSTSTSVFLTLRELHRVNTHTTRHCELPIGGAAIQNPKRRTLKSGLLRQLTLPPNDVGMKIFGCFHLHRKRTVRDGPRLYLKKLWPVQGPTVKLYRISLDNAVKPRYDTSAFTNILNRKITGSQCRLF